MRALPTYDQARMLPQALARTVTEANADANGHMNVRHYVGIFDDAEWAYYDGMGMGYAAAQEGTGGIFMLEQHLTYRREVLVGEETSVHVRMLARTDKVLHSIAYLLNHTRHEVAAAMEGLECWVDYDTRRISPFPRQGAVALDELIAEAAALDWVLELSGALTLAKSRPGAAAE